MNLGLALGLPFSGGRVKKRVVFDTFDRPDNATGIGNAETGQLWTYPSTAWGIQGNQAYPTSAQSTNLALIESGVSDCEVSSDVILGSTDGICCRATDGGNYVVARIAISSGGLGLFKIVSGTATQLGVYNFGAVAGNTYNIKIISNGASLKVLLDGVERISATDSFNQTATKHGLRVASGSAGVKYDNFMVETL